MRLQQTVKAVVRKGGRYYVAECVEIAVVTQGSTVDETLDNLRELWLFTWRARTLPISAWSRIPQFW